MKILGFDEVYVVIEDVETYTLYSESIYDSNEVDNRVVLLKACGSLSAKKVSLEDYLAETNSDGHLTLPIIKRYAKLLVAFLEELTTQDIELIKKFEYKSVVESVKKNLY